MLHFITHEIIHPIDVFHEKQGVVVRNLDIADWAQQIDENGVAQEIKENHVAEYKKDDEKDRRWPTDKAL